MEANVHAKIQSYHHARFSGLLDLCSSTFSMGALTMERRSTFTLYVSVNVLTLLTNNCRLPILLYPTIVPSCHLGDHRNTSHTTQISSNPSSRCFAAKNIFREYTSYVDLVENHQ
jgi:hypothetical protein